MGNLQIYEFILLMEFFFVGGGEIISLFRLEKQRLTNTIAITLEV